MPARRGLLERVLEGSFRGDRHQATLLAADLPAVPPDVVEDRALWDRLVELQAEYRAEELQSQRGKIAGEFQRVVAQLSEGTRRPRDLYEFVESVIGPHPRVVPGVDGVARFAAFCAEFLVHTKGRWAGQPLELEGWQVEGPAQAFRADDVSGLRLVEESYDQLGKKNGKSTFGSAAAAYLLLADNEPGPEVYGGAEDKDQARIVHAQCRAMLERSKLAPWCVFNRNEIVVPSVEGFYRVIAADAISDEGINLHGGILDELGKHTRRDLYDLFARSGIAREQPLVLSITNAPADDDSIGAQVRRQARAVVEGAADARTDLHVFAPELAEGELEDRDAWKQVNPASWLTVDLLERHRRRNRPVDWLRYFLNRPTKEEGDWLPEGAWAACLSDLDLPAPGEGDVFVGVDFASNSDTASVGWCGWRDERLVVRAHTWGVRHEWDDPAVTPRAHEMLPEGRQISLEQVENFIRDLAAAYSVRLIGYDAWRFQHSAEELEGEGAPMVAIPQTNERMCPASVDFLNLITERVIAHDDDPIVARHVSDAVAENTGRGWRLSKRHARHTHPMDACTSMMIAIMSSHLQAPPVRSAYEEGGLLVA